MNPLNKRGFFFMSGDINTRLVWREGEICDISFGDREKIGVTGKSNLEKYDKAWSPVHLMVSAVESCFLATFLAIAERSRVEIKSFKSTAEGVIDTIDGKRTAITSITIRPKVELINESDKTRLPKLFEKAEEYCTVGNSLNFKVKIA